MHPRSSTPPGRPLTSASNSPTRPPPARLATAEEMAPVPAGMQTIALVGPTSQGPRIATLGKKRRAGEADLQTEGERQRKGGPATAFASASGSGNLANGGVGASARPGTGGPTQGVGNAAGNPALALATDLAHFTQVVQKLVSEAAGPSRQATPPTRETFLRQREAVSKSLEQLVLHSMQVDPSNLPPRQDSSNDEIMRKVMRVIEEKDASHNRAVAALTKRINEQDSRIAKGKNVQTSLEERLGSMQHEILGEVRRKIESLVTEAVLSTSGTHARNKFLTLIEDDAHALAQGLFNANAAELIEECKLHLAVHLEDCGKQIGDHVHHFRKKLAAEFPTLHASSSSVSSSSRTPNPYATSSSRTPNSHAPTNAPPSSRSHQSQKPNGTSPKDPRPATSSAPPPPPPAPQPEPTSDAPAELASLSYVRRKLSDLHSNLSGSIESIKIRLQKLEELSKSSSVAGALVAGDEKEGERALVRRESSFERTPSSRELENLKESFAGVSGIVDDLSARVTSQNKNVDSLRMTMRETIPHAIKELEDKLNDLATKEQALVGETLGIKHVVEIINEQISSLGLSDVKATLEQLRTDLEDQNKSVEVHLSTRIDKAAQQSQSIVDQVAERKAAIDTVIHGLLVSVSELVKSMSNVETTLKEDSAARDASIGEKLLALKTSTEATVQAVSKEAALREIQLWGKSEGFKAELLEHTIPLREKWEKSLNSKITGIRSQLKSHQTLMESFESNRVATQNYLRGIETNVAAINPILNSMQRCLALSQPKPPTPPAQPQPLP